MRLYRVDVRLIFNRSELFDDYYIFANNSVQARARCTKFFRSQMNGRPYVLTILATSLVTKL